MATLHMELMSEALMRTVPMTVVLPHDALDTRRGRMVDRPLPATVYLLHGVFGSCTDWLYHADLRSLSESLNVAFVMPSAENKFYLDFPARHELFLQFVGDELPRLTRQMFKLSELREDTYIAGLSMGGYGALKVGMSYPETFGAIMAYSSGMAFYDADQRTNDVVRFIEGRDYVADLFGELKDVEKSVANPAVVASQMVADGRSLPRVFMSCGTEDSLLGVNRRFKAELDGLGTDVTYLEAPGRHSWDFWRMSLAESLEWAGLKKIGEAVSSGNVGV